MSLAIDQTFLQCAPGNTVNLTGSGFDAPVTASVGSQLVIPDDGTAPSFTGSLSISISSSFTTAASFQVPDGIRNGYLTVNANGSLATVALQTRSQYVQAAEFIGEGIDTSDCAPGELDAILQKASDYVDSYTGAGAIDVPGFRYAQMVERHKYRPKQVGPPRIWPWRPFHISSIDSVVFVTSNQIRTQFNVSQTDASDIFLNSDLGYSEILAYALGNYVLLGAIETIGFSANIIELGYTSGWKFIEYPAAIRSASMMIATELLTYRKIQEVGLGGFSSVKHGYQQYQRRTESFDIPAPAKDLLRPYIQRRVA